jgi:hypothetical protein
MAATRTRVSTARARNALELRQTARTALEPKTTESNVQGPRKRALAVRHSALNETVRDGLAPKNSVLLLGRRPTVRHVSLARRLKARKAASFRLAQNSSEIAGSAQCRSERSERGDSPLRALTAGSQMAPESHLVAMEQA